LADVGRQAAEMADSLVDDIVCSEDKHYDPENRRLHLRPRLIRHFEYIASGLQDLQQVEGKPGDLDAGQAELGWES